MENENDNVNPVEDKQELNIEDLPVDENQDEVKGGSQCQNNLKQLGIA